MARVPRRTQSPPCALAAFPPRVPPRPRVRAQGLRARSRKHRGLAAPFSRSRLGADSAPPRAGAFAPGPPRPTGLHPPPPRGMRGFPAPAEASLERCGARLFVLSLVTRVGIRSQKRASPKSHWCQSCGRDGHKGGGRAGRAAHLSSSSSTPWSARAAAGAHVGSGRVLAGDP